MLHSRRSKPRLSSSGSKVNVIFLQTARMNLLSAQQSLQLWPLHHYSALLFLHRLQQRSTRLFYTIYGRRSIVASAQGSHVQARNNGKNESLLEAELHTWIRPNYPIWNQHTLGQPQEEANKIIRHRQLNPPLCPRRQAVTAMASTQN